MMSEHARATVKTIDWSTVSKRGPFFELQKTVKIPSNICIRNGVIINPII